MSATPDPTVVRLKETRVGAAGLEGLVELSDGTEEWRPPSRVAATAVITRADGSIEHRDLNIGGE